MTKQRQHYIFSNESKLTTQEELTKAHAVGNQYYQPDTNVDVKPGFTRRDHEYWRSAESVAKKPHDIMRQCRLTYDQDGIIRSVIDLMVDMIIEGLEVIHPDKKINEFFDKWCKRVNLVDRAEKFANHLLVEGNVVVRRTVSRISNATLKEKVDAVAMEMVDVEPNMIPTGYIFYDPASVDLIGDQAAILSQRRKYGLLVGRNFLKNYIGTDLVERKRILQSLPKEIQTLLNNTSKDTLDSYNGSRGVIIPIPANRIYVTSLKKRDVDIWAKGPIYSILPDMVYNQKLRLAKLGALDGWNHSVRLWKLGDHNAEIFPDVGAFAKLAGILQHNVNGNTDIIWDSLINLETFYPPIEKLEKFTESYENVLIGLGIPKSLLGVDAETSSNIPSSLRNFIKRINGVRRLLLDWLNLEIGIIVKNLDIKTMPVVRFSYNNLFDQSSYFKILIELYDRSVISDRTILDKIGESFNLERHWAKEEYDLRTKDKIAPEFSPFYQPVIPDANKEIENIDGIKKEKAPNDTKKGRQPGAKDLTKRKRRFKSLSSLIALGQSIQDKLDLVLDKQFLNLYGADNKRKLTSEQKKHISHVKTMLLASLDNDNFSEKDDLLSLVNDEKVNKFIELKEKYVIDFGNVGVSDIRLINSMIYAELNSEALTDENL